MGGTKTGRDGLSEPSALWIRFILTQTTRPMTRNDRAWIAGRFHFHPLSCRTLSRTAWNGSEVDIAGGKAIPASADLNSSVRNKFRTDPEVLAEWFTASRIHRTGRRRNDDDTPPPESPCRLKPARHPGESLEGERHPDTIRPSAPPRSSPPWIVWSSKLHKDQPTMSLLLPLSLLPPPPRHF